GSPQASQRGAAAVEQAADLRGGQRRHAVGGERLAADRSGSAAPSGPDRAAPLTPFVPKSGIVPAMKSPFSLEGRTALITGGGTGIGQAIPLEVPRGRADVAVCSREVGHLEPGA